MLAHNLKMLLLFFVVLSIPKYSFSQAETFIENLPNVCEMHVYNDYLYFTTHEFDEEDNLFGSLGKINLREANAEVEYLFDIDFGFTGLYIKDDLLYYTVHTDSKLYYRNINDLQEEPKVFVDSIFLATDITIVGSKLFVIAIDKPFIDYDLAYVLVYDLESPEDPPIKLLENAHPFRIVPNGEYMYFGTMSRQIIRIDLLNLESEPEILLDSLRFPVGLVVVDNYLYFTDIEEAYSVSNARISRIDLAESQQENIMILTDRLRGPHELVYHDGYIYISENFISKISRVPVPFNTSTDEISSIEKVKVFPNPASQYIQLVGKENVDFDIFSIDGKKIMSGQVGVDSKINVDQLLSGFYFVHLSDGSIAKFEVEKR